MGRLENAVPSLKAKTHHHLHYFYIQQPFPLIVLSPFARMIVIYFIHGLYHCCLHSFGELRSSNWKHWQCCNPQIWTHLLLYWFIPSTAITTTIVAFVYRSAWLLCLFAVCMVVRCIHSVSFPYWKATIMTTSNHQNSPWQCQCSFLHTAIVPFIGVPTSVDDCSVCLLSVVLLFSFCLVSHRHSQLEEATSSNKRRFKQLTYCTNLHTSILSHPATTTL